jgi:hypothetical protein
MALGDSDGLAEAEGETIVIHRTTKSSTYAHGGTAVSRRADDVAPGQAEPRACGPNDMMHDTTDAALWRLYCKGVTYECMAQLTPRGVEARFFWNGRFLRSYLFQTEAELQAWVRDHYIRLVGEGWIDLGPAAGSEVPQ